MKLNNTRTTPIKSDSAFSSIDIVGQCLADTIRTKFFKKIIERTVKKGNIVVDLGSGSGILALFASKIAKKVVAVEFDPYVASTAKTNFNLNKAKNIQLLITDARSAKFGLIKKFDVVIAEMLTTGVIDEYQVQAINNLHKLGLVDESTKFIPERQDTYVALVNAKTNFFGQKILMILHLWKWHNWKNLKLIKFSSDVSFDSIDFRVINKESVDVDIFIDVKKTGVVNGLYLSSKSVFTNKYSLGDTEALNAPVFIPIKPRKVKQGEKVVVNISYSYGAGYESFSSSLHSG